MTVLSRRILVSRGAALLAATAITTPLTTRAQSEVSSTSGIVLTPAHAPNFDSLLAEHFPTLVDQVGFAAMRPTCVFLHNNTAKSVMAHSLVYSITTSTGLHQMAVQQMFAPRLGKHGSPEFGVSGNRTRVTGHVKLIRPSRIRLSSPFFSWSPNYLRKSPTPVWTGLNRLQSGAFLRTLLPRIASVSVELDAVVFSDHTVWGRDTAHLARTFRVRRNAEHDEARSVQEVLRAGASQAKLEQLLALHATSPLDASGKPVSRANPNAFLYHKTRQQHARLLLIRLLKDGMPKFTRTVHYVASRKKTVTTYV